MKTFFFFSWRALALCVLGPWPWPRAFLSLASRVSVLGKAVLGLGLGLGFFLCPWPWPWPRALCPRLHLCQKKKKIKSFAYFLSTIPLIAPLQSRKCFKIFGITKQNSLTSFVVDSWEVRTTSQW